MAWELALVSSWALLWAQGLVCWLGAAFQLVLVLALRLLAVSQEQHTRPREGLRAG